MTKRPFNVSPRLNLEGMEINYIDHNKRMSPLSRVMGKDAYSGPGSFRSQTKLISKGKSGRTSPDGDPGNTFLTENVQSVMNTSGIHSKLPIATRHYLT